MLQNFLDERGLLSHRLMLFVLHTGHVLMLVVLHAGHVFVLVGGVLRAQSDGGHEEQADGNEQARAHEKNPI